MMVARSLAIGWAIAMACTGHGDVAATSATLSIAVTDDTGARLPSRAYLTDATGKAVLPEGLPGYVKRAATIEEHFLVNGDCSFAVEPGQYHLRIERGLEWIASEQSLTLNQGETRLVEIVLQRWVNMNARGWYSGDTHIHRPPDQVELALLAEDLNFGVNLPYWNEKNEYARLNLPVPESSMKAIDPLRALCTGGQEIERLGNGWGAILIMGELRPLRVPKDTFHPLDAKLCEEARKQGAFVDIEKPVWLTTPVCAALGAVDSIGVVYNHYHPRGFLPMNLIRDCIITPPRLDMGPRECAEWTLQLYYHLLNCGLRLAASAGSANGVMPSPIGFERTYVKLEGAFSGLGWLEGLRAGRSFGTNGPIIDLAVDGKTLGDTIALSEKRSQMPVRVKVSSQRPLEVVEVIHNGNVIATEPLPKGINTVDMEVEVALGAGWIAARAFEPETHTQVYAQTSPIYLVYGDERGEVSESGEFYTKVIDELFLRIERDNLFPDTYHREQAKMYLQRARDFYADIGSRGNQE